MKSFILVTILITTNNILINSQKQAVIKETGKVVNLFDDGTWKYHVNEGEGMTKIETLEVSRPKASNFLIKSERLKYGVWLDKKKWEFTKNPDDDRTPSEYSFRRKGEDAYGLIIAEKIEIPIENLLDIAYQNLLRVAPDGILVKKECRKFDNLVVHFLQMEGTIQGVKFVYLGYYYSDKNGSIQFLCYTSQNLLNQYRPDIESLLNGFVILE